MELSEHPCVMRVCILIANVSFVQFRCYATAYDDGMQVNYLGHAE